MLILQTASLPLGFQKTPFPLRDTSDKWNSQRRGKSACCFLLQLQRPEIPMGTNGLGLKRAGVSRATFLSPICSFRLLLLFHFYSCKPGIENEPFFVSCFLKFLKGISSASLKCNMMPLKMEGFLNPFVCLKICAALLHSLFPRRRKVFHFFNHLAAPALLLDPDKNAAHATKLSTVCSVINKLCIWYRVTLPWQLLHIRGKMRTRFGWKASFTFNKIAGKFGLKSNLESPDFG